MSERREQFQVGDRPEVEVRLPSGTLRVAAGDAGRVTVEVRGPEADQFEIHQREGAVTVGLDGRGGGRWHSHDVVVTVPGDTSLRSHVASAGVSVDGDLARLDVHSASGAVVAPRVTGDVVVRAASGNVRLGSAGGDVRLSSASGDLEVASSRGAVTMNTAGGDVRLGRVGGALSVRSASGDVAVETYAGADLDCATVSGDVSIGLVPGRTMELDLFSLAGGIDNEFAVSPGPGDDAGDGDPGRVSVRSTAGDIRLRRAAAR